METDVLAGSGFRLVTSLTPVEEVGIPAVVTSVAEPLDAEPTVGLYLMVFSNSFGAEPDIESPAGLTTTPP